MEDNSNKDSKKNFIGKFPRTPKYPVKWQFLLVGDHGKIISIQRFKQIVIFFLLILILSVSAAVGFFFLFQNKTLKNKNLKASLSQYQKTALKLQQEKEILSARLVVHGIDANIGKDNKKTGIDKHSEINETQDNLKTSDNIDSGFSFKSESDPGIKGEPTFDNHSEKLPEQEKEKSEESQIKSSEIQSGIVDVGEFKISRDPKANILKAQFKVSNTSNHTITGYIFVFLKRNKSDQDSWLSLPSAQLNNGAAIDYKNGHHFVISRFKIIRLKTKDPQNAKEYVQGIVLIYGKDGNLIFRKKFPVNT